jgi:hypothetical protein
LPDISKINALAIGSVSKVDGLAKASISTIDGVAVPSGPILDALTGVLAGYSVRRLRTAYTGDIMRVRRDSDNNEIDVGFDSNDEFGLTSPVSNATSGSFTDFADFIGHGGTPANGFCRYWYDQSSNANDAGQATQGSQPQIYDSGTGIITKGSRPSLAYATNYTSSLSLTTSLATVYSTFDVRETPTASAPSNFLYGHISNADYHSYASSNLPIYLWALAGSANVRNGDTRENQTARDFTTYQYTPGSHVQLTMINLGTANISQLSQDRFYTNRSWGAKWQESLIFSLAKTADRDTIEADQKAYFGTP